MNVKLGYEESSKAVTAHVYVEGEESHEVLREKLEQEMLKSLEFSRKQTQLKLMRN